MHGGWGHEMETRRSKERLLVFAGDRCCRYYQKHCLVLCPPRVCEKKWISRGGIIFLGGLKWPPGHIWMLTGKAFPFTISTRIMKLLRLPLGRTIDTRWFSGCCGFVFFFGLPLTFRTAFLFTRWISEPISFMPNIKHHLRSRSDPDPELPWCRFLPPSPVPSLTFPPSGRTNAGTYGHTRRSASRRDGESD